jgi:hypothetical protein
LTKETGYLRRLAARREHNTLKRQIVFAMGLGWGLMIFGAVKYFLVVGAYDRVWQIVGGLGAVLLAVSIVAPQLVAPVERVWMRVAESIGKVVFSTILVFVYFLVISPVGALLRWRRGSDPFYAWDQRLGEKPEGWAPKVSTALDRGERTAKRPMVYQLVSVLAYFGKSRSYVFIPALTVLLALGLLLFFAQTSSLAPFIYTLF